MPLSPQSWHAKPVDSAIALLNSSLDGLSQGEASKRLATHGPNQLPTVGPTPAWRLFLRQFSSPLIYVLLAAAVVSVLIGEFQDAGFIVAVLLINAGIGSYQEYHAERSSLALRKLLSCDGHVLPDGEIRQIPAEQIVPGDIVWLESGELVSWHVWMIALVVASSVVPVMELHKWLWARQQSIGT